MNETSGSAEFAARLLHLCGRVNANWVGTFAPGQLIVQNVHSDGRLFLMWRAAGWNRAPGVPYDTVELTEQEKHVAVITSEPLPYV